VLDQDSPVARFEAAVEAIVAGDQATLEQALRADPTLVSARSSFVTHNDPPRHHATLLHYTAANGVEAFRQKTPANAVEIATALLCAGAEPDALAHMYGQDCTTMSMLVSSAHPALAGLQVALAETLLDFGADPNGRGSGTWATPLLTALAFGYQDTARALAARGARVDNLAATAGLGLVDQTAALYPSAVSLARHKAVALAAQHGHTEVLRLLLDAGEDPSRYNPEGNHGHSTPLHQAVWSDHLDTVRLLVERGARLDIRDTIHQGTPLGWAEFGQRVEIAVYLKSAGA
jgi:ankyrin repeat protein